MPTSDKKLQIELQIQDAIARFNNDKLYENSIHLFETLGYNTARQDRLEAPTFHSFKEAFIADEDAFNEEKAQINEWQKVELLFQLTAEEFKEQINIFETRQVDKTIIETYLFFAIDLKQDSYTRTKLSLITREVNRLFPMPVMILFKHGGSLTLSIINRRLHKKDESKDVLEKVTLIKDINIGNPHRAHIEILFDLSFDVLHSKYKSENFVELHNAWQKTLDTSELNKKFYREIADWYFCALQKVAFPDDAEKDAELRNATSLIRLITRLIFVWFLKEKGLVPERLFDQAEVDKLLNKIDKTGSTYYKAIIQNLFFATLNTEMNRDKAGSRRFVKDQYMVHIFYRYQRYFKDPDAALKLFEDIPFLNGGLFECLDRKDGAGNEIRIDCFSENPKHETRLKVPDELFFADEQTVDLSEVFGDKRRAREKVRGIIRILDSYKFTVAENTPLEEEVALDPELLGKVFENLLASYNPETKTTARKQTGSFYTPREIVNYMVDESLIAYLETKLVEYHEAQTTFGPVTPPSQKEMFGKGQPQQTKLATKKVKLTDKQKQELNDRLRQLFAYTEEGNPFSEAEIDVLIRAIDACKILDPACGSGAFPMGILHRLVYLLGKLDPDNRTWREVQKARAIQETEEAYNLGDRAERKRRLEEIEETFDFNSSDYGRKLHLIENCIYGVDIQPIACQIAKLRFFISLVVEQQEDRSRSNFGIRPLPNLETRFVAANTLIGIERQLGISEHLIREIRQQLKQVRHRYFTARTYKTKEKCRKDDADLRKKMADELESVNVPGETRNKLASWNPYDQNASADFFDMEWMFGIRDGFGVVIGNPPYVRQEQIKELKPNLKQQFQCYTGVADLYVYFYERGFRLLRQNGVLTYISSNKYFRSGYGKKLREYFVKHAAIRQIIDFGDAPVFEATAYPSIIVLQKAVANNRQTRALKWQPGPPITEFDRIFWKESFFLSQKEFTADGWRLESPEVLRLLKKLRATGTPLGEYVNGRFYYGIKTGLNKAFVVDRATRDRLITEHPSSAEVIRPLLRGRDVKRWRVEFAEQYLIKIESSENVKHPWSGKATKEAEKAFAETYPAIHARFQLFRELLVKRDDQGKYFWELRSCAYWREFEQPKIIYPNIWKRNEFAWDENKFYANQKTFIIPGANKSLLAILNSNAATWIFSNLLSKLQNGYFEPSAIFMKDFPLPVASNNETLAKMASQVLEQKQQDPNADTRALENRIDLMVYKLYGLTWPEVKIVDPELAMSKEEYNRLHFGFQEELATGS